MNISISNIARIELKQMGVGGSEFMRISVVPGGCSGMSYSASIDSSLGEADELVYDADGLRVISDKGSALYLDGLQIDFSDDLIHSGFRFTNPKASHTCGCGASFKV
jgi:iron-sulfur cluster assembly protein